MATIVASATGGNWNTNAAWVGSVQPSATSDVQLSASSGPITTTIGNVCRSLDCTGYTNTLSLAVASSLAIGDGTTGLSNIALKLVAGMTIGGSLSTISFVGSSATTQTITTAGKTLAALTFTTGKYQFQDALTIAGIMTFTAGTLDMNGQTVSMLQFSSTLAGTRTLTMGASAITCTNPSSGAWNTQGATNMTITSNTATVTCNGATGGFSGTTGLNMNGLSIVLSGSGACQLGNSFTMANFTRTGTAVTTDILTVAGSPTITSTFAVNGNSNINRLLVQSSVLGTARTVTAATVTVSYVDFSDTTGAGAGNWSLSAAGQNPTGGAGDAGGNTSITFTTAATQTWQGTTSGSWSNVAKWSTRIPLPQDDVSISSAFSASQTITQDMPRCGKSLDCTGTTGAPTLLRGSGVSPTFYGSITLAANVIMSNGGTWFMAGRSSHTLTTAGVVLNGNWTLNTPTGTYSLADAMTMTGATGLIIVTTGTFNSAGFAVTCATFTVASAGNFTAGGSTFTLTATSGVVWNIGSAVVTMTGSPNIVIGVASTSSRTLTLQSSKIHGNVTYTIANSPGELKIGTGGGIIGGNLNIGTGRALTITISTTLILIGNLNITGQQNNYIYLPGVAANYLSAPDSVALSITGDIDLRCRVALDDWTPAANMMLVGKWLTAGQFSYRIFVTVTTGILRFDLTNDGTTVVVANSSVAPTVSDGAPLWIRVTWRASDGQVQFFTASGLLTNPVAADFTQLGTNQTISIVSVPSIFDSTTSVEVGSQGGGASLNATGQFYRAQIRNGIDGTVVFDADMVGKLAGTTTFTESSAQAATVTVNGTLALAGDGSVSLASTAAGTAGTLVKGYTDAISGSSWRPVGTLTYSTDYLTLPGTASNYVVTDDTAALSITGDIDLRVQVALDDWTPTNINTLIAKNNSTGNQKAYQLYIDSAGKPTLGLSSDGSTVVTAASSVATGVADGAVKWIRATWVDSTNVVQFFTSDDGTAWTQLGSNASCASVGILDSTASVEIGSHTAGATNPAAGKFYRAQIYNGVAGTLVADVTLSKTIVSNDYLSIKDSVVTGGATFYAGSTSTNVSGNTGWIFTSPPDRGRMMPFFS